MHYEFQLRLNKLDSRRYKGLLVPEIDRKLNEAQEVFINTIVEPRHSIDGLGFEANRRNKEDIKTLVVNPKKEDFISASVWDDISYLIPLPEESMYLINAIILAEKGDCKDIELYDSVEVKHDAVISRSGLEGSSFEWRKCNYRIIKEGVRLFTDGTFKITKVGTEYIRWPKVIHNAEDWIGGTYQGLDGVTYTGTQDCELSKTAHSTIVDLAVLITAGDIDLSGYNLRLNKFKIVNN